MKFDAETQLSKDFLMQEKRGDYLYTIMRDPRNDRAQHSKEKGIIDNLLAMPIQIGGRNVNLAHFPAAPLSDPMIDASEQEARAASEVTLSIPPHLNCSPQAPLHPTLHIST